MANTLTGMIPDIYAALDVVSRELVGFIPAVQRDASADRVAVGENLTIPVAPANAAAKDATPAMAFPAAADQNITGPSLTISKQRAAPFSWTGAEQRAVNAGPGFLTLQQAQIAQALRTLVNEIETDIAVAIYKAASRAYGTAGTTPFASTLADPANVRKILDDNGAPPTDRTLVINTTAGVALRTLATVNKVNEWGTDEGLRAGVLLDIHGFGIRESAKVQSHTKGTGTGYLVNNAGPYPVGTTSIILDTGSGTVVAGDVVTFAGDTNKYLVTTGVGAPGTIVIAAPGLQQTLADNVAMTIGNNYTANVGLSRNAFLLGARLPDIPAEGDLASDRIEITDPRTGLSFEFATYPGYRMVTYEVAAAWGVKAIKPEHMAVLLG